MGSDPGSLRTAVRPEPTLGPGRPPRERDRTSPGCWRCSAPP